MSDELDWDDEDFEVADLATVGQQKVAKEINEKFEGEDEEEAPQPKPASQPKPAKAKEPSKYADRGATAPIEEPLDDPVAEKLRQAKRQEEADFRHTLDMFGGDSAKKLEGFTPVSASDFEEYAQLVVMKYLTPHRLSNHYKALIKHTLKEVSSTLSPAEIKDLENCLAGVKFEKQRLAKIEKENAAKKGKKASIKFEKTSMSAGLDDDIYDYDDDDDGFM